MIRSLGNRRRLIAGVVLIFVVFGVVYFKKTPRSQAGARSGVVKREDLVQRVTIAGLIAPARKTIVIAPYNGYVRKLHVKLGDKLKAGDPVVSIAQSLAGGDPVFPLRAPFAGTVVLLEKFEGEYVKEGDLKEFIARIDDTSSLYAISNAPEIDRVNIVKGQEATVKAPAVFNRSYKGVVRDMALAAKEKDSWRQTQPEFTIRTEILDPDENLHPGMSVLLDIVTSSKKNVLTLRHEFIQKEKGAYFVYLSSGTKKQVQVGIQNEEASEITEGLQEGDKVRPVDFSAMLETLEKS